MQEFICVTGMILKQAPIGEYDRRICLLTKERGKISAFARSARKPGNRLAAATAPFSFGRFKLYAGKTSYNVMEADIHNYFEELRTDFEGAYFGMYFTEVADYYTRENNDEKEMLKLLYQSLRALTAKSLSNGLVKAVFEIKSIVINGEYPGPPRERVLKEGTLYALQYISQTPVERLYTFTVTPQVLAELKAVAEEYMRRFTDRQFKCLEILKTLC